MASSQETASDPPEHTVTLLENEDLPGNPVPWDDGQLPIDILLLTVKDCEFLGCISYLNRGFRKTYHDDLGAVYLGDMGENEPKLRIAVMKSYMGSGGPGGSTVVVMKAVGVLMPKAVFYVGFCGGLNFDKVKLGDVVLSAKLITYAPSKHTANGIEERGVNVPLNSNLSRMILNAGEGWKAPLKDPKDLKVKIHRGTFLSGPEVIDNNERRNALVKRFPEAIAVEMEGEGLFAAAHDLQINWIIIKGVSDYADGRKSKTNSWRPFASLMAASLTAHILSSPIPFQGLPHYGKTSERNQAAGTSPSTSSAGVLHGEGLEREKVEKGHADVRSELELLSKEPNKPSEKVLNKLSRDICTVWESLGRELEVPQGKLDEISVSGLYLTPQNKAFQMLNAWKNRGKSVTYDELCRALKEHDLNELAESLRTF